ncbi:MAG: hypothetical protein NC300_02035 [Bacteroidales bacterium]|nr:hypothetical protein [Clostridium sp.]MCM1202904.1 hypothetical protein [Bacteroidales bacterium]
MYAWIQKEKGKFFLLLNGLIAIMVILFFFPTYENNDDFFMGAISAGLMGKKYSQCLIFSNVVYGYLLKLFGMLIGQINWYVMAEYILIMVSVTSIFYVVSHYVPVWFAAALNLFSWYLCFFAQLRAVQFTRTAGICVVAGCFLLWHSYRKGSRKMKILGIILCVTGSMIRLECFPVCFAFFLLFELCLCMEKGKWNKELFFRLLKDTLILVCLVGLFKGLDMAYYQSSEEWKAYTRYNSIRSELMDYGVPDFSTYRENYEEIGFNQNDTIVLANWILEDSDKFTFDRLEEVASWKESDGLTLVTVKHFAGDFLKRNFDNRLFYLWIAMMVFILSAKTGKTIKLFAAGNACGLGVLYFILYYIGRVVPRVEYVIWLAAVFSMVMCLLHFYPEKEENAAKSVRILAGAAVFFVLVSGIYYIDEIALPHKAYAREPAGLLQELSEDGENIYLLNALCFGDVTLCYKPYLRLPEKYFYNTYYTGGWTSHSPFQKEWSRRLGLENPMADLADKDNYYYVKYTDWGIDAELQYLRDNYGKKITCTPVKEHGAYTIYQFSGK